MLKSKDFKVYQMDSLIDLVGYIAASLVFAAFYVKKITTLRLIAIGSNVAFIIYGFGQELYPIFILHSMLLPLNLYRLFELKRTELASVLTIIKQKNVSPE